MDFFIFQQINSFAGKWYWLDVSGIFFAKYLGYVLVFIVFLFLIKNSKKYWSMVVKGFLAAILARFGIVELIRWLWERPRPFIENHVNLLMDKLNQPAFPSGHAAFFFALSIVIYSYNKKAGIFFFIASFLISISRVFTGIHWPLDILAGAVIGIISGWTILKVFSKFSESID